ncbi:MAG: SDR family NAD(P)-dependent oxidoreductase [Halobacteriota archaeon]|uniref:SDR family NAD(P)-dependent oxidoreductase n=1 Tax=Halodesulfurarchaeum sp. HSR-GB TaxID=3074077 RepID=UPI002861B5FC|nr:SDR family NAD(P)-dependent oxidoreductase [Halodesulfurarchaeum sp. HSR-GB]MDR5655647.1 SDR family oxidoreductase [Halodesulfurarchaeum sp. HSR-GB]
MDVSFDFTDRVTLVTGVSGSLGSAVAEAFLSAGATVAGTDRRPPSETESDLGTEQIAFYEADLTDEAAVESLVAEVIEDHGRLDYLLNVAGTWAGGDPIEETDLSTFEMVFDVNLKTMFLASKHALPHLQATEGAIVNVSAKASLSGGQGDGPYRASKAGVRLLTETIAEEQSGVVRANAVMPSVIDTPANREMIPNGDFDAWVAPEAIARTMLALCSDATVATSGAAVPVFGEA